MVTANHAMSGSGGSYCCRCSSAMGEAVKVQPTIVDGSVYCPRCFCWWRMNQNTGEGFQGANRFNATQAAACKCQFCGWTVISFGARPGERLRCTHCSRPGCIKIPLEEGMFTKVEREAIADAARAGEKLLPRMRRTG